MRISLRGVIFGGASGGGRRHRKCPFSSRLAAAAASSSSSSSSPRSSAAQPLTRSAAMAEKQDGRPVHMVGDVRDAPAGRENDLETIELARFAVAEHNSKANAVLEFERLVKVRQQTVAGTMHYFTVEVKEAGGAKKLYEAKVWEKVWENFKQLQSFEPVGDAAAA